ncbi:MAG TPA: hypothetical protein VG498_07285 [Terriglobales bacterium]|nr:hypothetical protein [Terriglobales bacterium]
MTGTELAKVGVIFFAVSAALVVLPRLPGILRIPCELRRKTLHIGAGLVALSLPLLFERATPVAVLSTAILLLLIALRLSTNPVYQIDRVSYGELCIPLAVFFLFALTRGERASYYVALMVFTFADSCAAMAGRRWPRYAISIFGNQKTIAGSASFLVAALAVTLGGLALSSGGVSAKSILTAALISLVLTIVEALSVYGLDNFLVPAAAFGLLHVMTHTDVWQLGFHFGTDAKFALKLALQDSTFTLWK